MLFQVNNSYLYCNEEFGSVIDYYRMIVDHILYFLYNHPEMKINITLSNNNYTFNNDNQTIKISINCEHTLVKMGGRDVPFFTPFGTIDDDDNNKYLVRIDKYFDLINSDIIIDYSIPNICNVQRCNMFDMFSKKHIYISSSIYDSYFIKENRNNISLTTFANVEEPRRAKLLKNIRDKKLSHINVHNCFDKNELQKLYKNTKILINIHQTPHHHTVEEFRILPALECGVIVVSEISPLITLIPYHDYVIWETYDNVIEKTIEIQNNYEYYHNLIFSTPKMRDLADFKNINYNNLSYNIHKTYKELTN